MTMHYPVEQVILQPTPYCNLDCKYCYLPNRADRSRMTPQLPADVLSFIHSSNLSSPNMQLVWHAGEPLAAGLKFYEEALRHISSKNFPNSISQSIQTNATLINDAWCAFFKEHHFSVGVSLDGPEFLHDDQRLMRSGKGSFGLAMRGVELLQKHGITPTVIAVITSKSLDYADEIYDFFEKIGIESLGINIEEQDGVNYSKTIHTSNFIEKCFIFFQRLYERSRAGKVSIREVERVRGVIFKKSVEIKNMLSQPFRILSVDYAGNFSTFCPELLGMSHKKYGTFSLGNIYKTSLLEVLSSIKFRQIHEDIQEGVRNCEKSCEYFFLCGGGAPTNKLYENGSFESTETFNCVAKVKIPVQVILPSLEQESLHSRHELSSLDF